MFSRDAGQLSTALKIQEVLELQESTSMNDKSSIERKQQTDFDTNFVGICLGLKH